MKIELKVEELIELINIITESIHYELENVKKENDNELIAEK